MDLSCRPMLLVTCKELVVKLEAVTLPWTARLVPIVSELERVTGPPMLAWPRTSRLLVITEPLRAMMFPIVIISPRAPKFPRDEMLPVTNRLLPVLILPVTFTVPSTSRFPRFLRDPWI